MKKFNDFDELCLVKYNDRWLAMVSHHNSTKQVTANYEKCDGSYETMQEAIRHIVGIEIPNEEVLLGVMSLKHLDKIKAITFTKSELEKLVKTLN